MNERNEHEDAFDVLLGQSLRKASEDAAEFPFENLFFELLDFLLETLLASFFEVLLLLSNGPLPSLTLVSPRSILTTSSLSSSSSDLVVESFFKRNITGSESSDSNSCRSASSKGSHDVCFRMRILLTCCGVQTGYFISVVMAFCT